MKVLTKNVNIENKEFVLVQGSNAKYHNKRENNDTFYGLIPYDEIDENGRMKRTLNGFEMGIADSISEAIENVRVGIKIDKWKAAHVGYTETELIEFVLQLRNK